MTTIVSNSIQQAAGLLRQNKLVAIPTETVYGLAANAFSHEAVIQIFETKNRPHFDPLIVHVSSMEKVDELVAFFPEIGKKLAREFWPGPLTIVLKKKPIIPDIVTSGLDTVGIRMPDHPMTLDLLRQLDFPLAAPSANPFGYISPTSAAHVKDQLGEKIPMILDGGICRVGLESTIIDLSGITPCILRLGGITIEEITSCIGEVKVMTSSTSNPTAPGMLISHYSPRKTFVLGNIESMLMTYSEKKIAVMSFQKAYPGVQNIILSPTGNLREAASNLFSAMRELDVSHASIILAELVPEEGLGRAINDKLRRASNQ